MTRFVVHQPNGSVIVVEAPSPSAALRMLTEAPIRTRPGVLIAGGYSTTTPMSWS